MKQVTEIYSCDVCKEQTSIQSKDIQVIFESEQTEGRQVKPYLYTLRIDICNVCLDKILSGNYMPAAHRDTIRFILKHRG